jgi:hypothetical protein
VDGVHGHRANVARVALGRLRGAGSAKHARAYLPVPPPHPDHRPWTESRRPRAAAYTAVQLVVTGGSPARVTRSRICPAGTPSARNRPISSASAAVSPSGDWTCT